jgi:electron transfer flavoprotein beta subunit
MKILVLVKSVPKSDTRVNVVDGVLNESDFSYELNIYDEYAIEAALQLKDARDASVILLTLGPDRCEPEIRKGLAMGADEAFLLADEAFLGGDARSTAHALAAACKHIGFDLILSGKQAIDSDQAQVGIRVAELLGIPHAGTITQLEVEEDGSSALCSSEIEGGHERIQLSLPALATCQKGLGEPRFASLPGIMKAKRKKLTRLSPDDLGVDAATVGAAGSGTEVLSYAMPPQRAAGRLIDGDDAAAKARNLAQLLREEAKAV